MQITQILFRVLCTLGRNQTKRCPPKIISADYTDYADFAFVSFARRPATKQNADAVNSLLQNCTVGQVPPLICGICGYYLRREGIRGWFGHGMARKERKKRNLCNLCNLRILPLEGGHRRFVWARDGA